MDESWVDFKALKKSISMQQVMNHYKIDWLRKEKDELVGRCPIHKGEGTRAFHLNPTKNAFNCFSCRAKGNILDFVAAMEECSVRDAALKLRAWFPVQMTPDPVQPSPKSEPVSTHGDQPTVNNRPLGFELKGIDPTHAYFAGRGIKEETARMFGAGFFGGRGSMSGRIVFPIHDERGELVAYAGRSIDDAEPRYKLPPGFHKSAVLYNLHRVSGRELILVEGFFDCMKVWQAGFHNVVALMGCTMSKHQEALITSRFTQVLVILDGDEPGQEGATEICSRLILTNFVRRVILTDGMQPDQLSETSLGALLTPKS